MGFASAYLEKRALFPEQISEAPESNTGIIVVVPAYNEPGIALLLDSLASCSAPECGVEVIIVVNAPDNASAESLENNSLCLNNIKSWKETNSKCFFRLFSLDVKQYSVKGWGVGLARKTGMDEALRRFDAIGSSEGVILNVDADCTVDRNYFQSVYRELYRNKARSACSIYFEHPLTGSDFQASIYKYITLYELHLRYYCQGLALAGFPYVFHTVGSAIAVKAMTYIKAGGMNRRQAGEDFYFIQKLVPLGGYFSLNSTVVHPSPRSSFRVPFGTGASIQKLTNNSSPTFLTYNINAFLELKDFFSMTDLFFGNTPDKYEEIFTIIPKSLQSFLNREEFITKLAEIRNNTTGIPSFRKRFFGWFNMFMIVKYLNFSHQGFFEKMPADVAASELLRMRNVTPQPLEPLELLQYYRVFERGDS